MCGRAGAHTSARDRRTDGARPVGCSTSEQSASRASAPTHTRHTRRTGPTHTRHTARRERERLDAGSRAPGRRRRTRPPGPRWTRVHEREHTGARASARRSKIKGTRGAGRRTHGKRGPRTRTLTICARARDRADMTRVRARHATHTGTRRTDARHAARTPRRAAGASRGAAVFRI